VAGSQTLKFEILGEASSASRAFKDTASGAALAARGAKQLADSLGLQSKSAQVSAAATLSLVKSDDLLRDAELALAASADEASSQLRQQGRAAEETAVKTRLAGDAAKGAGGGFGLLASPMGAAVAAGVALSPVIATVGTGMAGLALAAESTVKPILEAGTATAQAKEALAGLDPAQKAAYQSLGALKTEFSGFSKSLEPEVLGVFNKGLHLASGLLGDIQPVAAATGKALGSVLGEVDAEFRSQSWQRFFGFMAENAGPDVRMLGNVVVDLTADLPPLLEALQPVAAGFLTLADDAAKAIGAVEAFGAPVSANAQSVAKASEANRGFFGSVVHYLDDLKLWQTQALGVKQANDGVAGSTHALGDTAARAAPPLHGLGLANQFVQQEADSASSAVGKLNSAWSAFLGLSSSLVTAQLGVDGDLKTLTADAKAAGGSFTGVNDASQKLQSDFEGNLLPGVENVIGGMRQAHASAADLASVLSTDLKPAVDAGALSNKALRQQIYDMAVQAGYTGPNQLKPLKGWIDGNAGSAQNAADKVSNLSAKLASLPKAVGTRVSVTATAQGTLNAISHLPGLSPTTGSLVFTGGAARGMMVTGGTPGRDSVLIAAMPGEVVVPTAMVKAGAVDHLRGSIPGFAAGGVVDLAGPAGFAARSEGTWAQKAAGAWAQASKSAFEGAAAKAAAAAAAALAGPGGGAPSANAALAKRLYPAYASGAVWDAWNYVAMRESGWNQFATNPSSGAYGIGQALPYTKMPKAAWPASAGGSSNPTAQIEWMWNYMAGRYGGPVGAAAHERQYNWYGNGLDAVIGKPTLIGVGERGPEHVQVTPVVPGRGGGGTVEVHLHVNAPVGSQQQLENWLQEGINKLARTGRMRYALRESPSARG
jgi:hypothetical protein